MKFVHRRTTMKNARTKAKNAILSYLGTVGSATRREVLDGAILLFGLSKEELEGKNQSGRYGTARSYLGATLSELVRLGDVGRGGRGYLLNKEEAVLIREDETERKIRASLKNRAFTRRELLRHLENIFGTKETKSTEDDDALECMVDAILVRLTEEGEVTLENNRYFLTPKTPCEKCPKELDDFKIAFFDLLSARGGPAFERYIAGLLEKYFLMTGKEVLFSETLGGSNDGGIDVRVDVIDSFGFVDHILIQTKCRSKMHVTEKEVREFYGALCARGGSRGMYITTSTFHIGAQNFLDSLDNVVGVDGEKIFSLALQTRYGIQQSRAGYLFDTKVFD